MRTIYYYVLFPFCRNRGLARKCCYDSKGEFTPGPPSVITNQTKYPDKGASVFSLFREKIVPYMKCCMFSDNCFKYQELGIPEKDSGYMPPTIGTYSIQWLQKKIKAGKISLIQFLYQDLKKLVV